MKKRIAHTLVSALVGMAAVSGLAHAQDGEPEFLDIGFGGAAYLSTLGVGGQGIVTLNDYISIGGGFDAGGFTANFQGEFGELKVEDGKIDFSTLAPHAVVGLHPFSNDIRLAAGVAWADLSANGKFNYDGIAYDGDFDINIKNSQQVAPVLTAGFAHSTRGGIGIYTEVGAMFAGELEYSSTATNNCGSNAVCEAERKATKTLIDKPIKDALEFYPGFYPIARFGLRISF